MSKYHPPFSINSQLLNLVAQISELLGRWAVSDDETLSPRLRRGNRIRTIQASLAIEQNTLTLDQVTAVLEGKRVLGLPREIQEVRNAFAAYEKLDSWSPYHISDLLSAHEIMMTSLVDDAGRFRSGGVGIYRGNELVHMAPPASRVQVLVQDLLQWLENTDVHPLIASCVFHYEFEFIHPFSDGNGRMGRLWQSLILAQWKPVLAYLPVETVIRDRQDQYYQALEQSDQQSNATVFLEFMLQALYTAMLEVSVAADVGDQVSDHVSDQVKALLSVLPDNEALTASELMAVLELKHRPTFRLNYLTPALAAGLIRMTKPESPRSPVQKYRMTSAGRAIIKSR